MEKPKRTVTLFEPDGSIQVFTNVEYVNTQIQGNLLYFVYRPNSFGIDQNPKQRQVETTLPYLVELERD